MADDWIATKDRLPQVGQKVETRADAGAPILMAWRFTGFPGWSHECEWFTEGDRGTQMIPVPMLWRPSPAGGKQP